jgi:cytochrome c
MVFEKRCANCHAMEKNKDGPKLVAVVGRRAGSVSGFEYSDALKSTHLTWTEATLDKWLADPDVLVPGNSMEFRLSKAEDRRDLIEYLKR